MNILDSKKITEIQQEFNTKFNNLKIEFYTSGHEEGEGSKDSERINPNETIGNVRQIQKTGDLSINGHLKVSTLEQRFLEDYGLNVQVFRRSGSIWLQTTSTDSWTLTEQNEHGKTPFYTTDSE